MTLLIIAPTFDVPTTLSTIAANHLTSFLKEKNVPFYFLTGLIPGRFYFETFFKSHPDLDAIFYLGHATEDKVIGSEIFSAMLDQANDDLLKRIIVWTMACLTAVSIGPDTVKKGARTWFGHLVLYNGAFPDESHDFLTDWVDYITVIPKMLAQGATTGQAFEAYKSKIAGYIAQYTLYAQDPEKYPNMDWILPSTISNLTQYRLLGDFNARISHPATASLGSASPS